MTAHDLTIAVYALIALVGVGLQLLSYGSGSRIPSLEFQPACWRLRCQLPCP